jgi:Protein phosphatase 2C
MQIYQLLQRGAYHADFCEDFSVVQPLGAHHLLLAVLDGCTMGRESHFASTLVAKVLRKVVKERAYRQFYGDLPTVPQATELREIMAAMFEEMRQLKSQLHLETTELLTTLVVALLDTHSRQVVVLALGDATVALNGQLTRFEQDNRPDYLAYHLHRPFAEWYDQQQQILQAPDCTDLALATDGIDSFAPTDTAAVGVDVPDVPAYLLLNQELAGRNEMLTIKMRRLARTFGLVPTDDVAILRVRLA